MRLDLARTLAWRLRRHALDPVAGTTVADIAQRVVALRGWPFDLADLAICVRQAEPKPGALEQALEAGDVIRSYAFRGGSYVFTHEIAAVLLAVRTTTRVWETRRYQRQGGFELDDWAPFREAVREVLSAGPATREEIGAHLARIPSLRHLAVGATGAGSDSLYKPLHWWGDICFGPTRDGQATFRWLADDPRWPGLPDLDEAGRRAVVLYLGAYGPATLQNLTYWLTEGLSVPRQRLLGWVTDLCDELTEVVMGDARTYVLSADLEEMSVAEPSNAVRLLPGFDPWVMGPGTADTRIVAAPRRAVTTRGANLVVRGGVVCGTWRLRGLDLLVSWYKEAGAVPAAALDVELQLLARVRGQELQVTLNLA